MALKKSNWLICGRPWETTEIYRGNKNSETLFLAVYMDTSFSMFKLFSSEDCKKTRFRASEATSRRVLEIHVVCYVLRSFGKTNVLTNELGIINNVAFNVKLHVYIVSSIFAVKILPSAEREKRPKMCQIHSWTVILQSAVTDYLITY